MLNMRGLKKVAWLGLITGMLVGPTAFANHGGTGVYVNGVELMPQQIALIQHSTGQTPAPGHYLVQNGCVAHLESGQVYCPQTAQGGGYSYGGSAGGGYGYNNGAGGSWFHRSSDYAGGYSVGGDGSGCIYTPNWSNC